MNSTPVYLTFGEAGEVARVSANTIRWWCQTGKLRSYRPGRHPLIKREELIAFIERTASAVVEG